MKIANVRLWIWKICLICDQRPEHVSLLCAPQAHLVAAFEKSLSNMTCRLQSLTMTAEQKVQEPSPELGCELHWNDSMPWIFWLWALNQTHTATTWLTVSSLAGCIFGSCLLYELITRRTGPLFIPDWINWYYCCSNFIVWKKRRKKNVFFCSLWNIIFWTFCLATDKTVHTTIQWHVLEKPQTQALIVHVNT